MVVREEIQSKRAATVGRKLMELPGYLFRFFVTNRSDSSLEIWRDYKRWAASNAASTNELAADHFCLRSFFAAQSAFLAVLFCFNLLSEFQLAVDPTLKTYKQPAHPAFRAFYLRYDPWSQRTLPGTPHVQKLGWLFPTKAAL